MLSAVTVRHSYQLLLIGISSCGTQRQASVLETTPKGRFRSSQYGPPTDPNAFLAPCQDSCTHQFDIRTGEVGVDSHGYG